MENTIRFMFVDTVIWKITRLKAKIGRFIASLSQSLCWWYSNVSIKLNRVVVIFNKLNKLDSQIKLTGWRVEFCAPGVKMRFKLQIWRLNCFHLWVKTNLGIFLQEEVKFND